MKKNNAAPNTSEPRSNTRVTQNNTTHHNKMASQARGSGNSRKPKHTRNSENRKPRALGLAKKGYDITPLKGGKAAKQPQKSGWVKAPQLTPEDIELDTDTQWHGIGLRTQNFPTIDIDITDPELNRQVVDFVKQTLGEIAPEGLVLLRYGMKPKVAIPCRLLGEPFNKKVSVSVSAKTSGDETSSRADQKVEILGKGQHVVIDGKHSKTGSVYEWRCESNGQLRNGLAGIPAEQLPRLSEEDVTKLIEGINGIIQAWGEGSESHTTSSTNYSAPSDNFDTLDFTVHVLEFKQSPETEQRVTVQDLKSACERLRECGYLDDHNNWIKVGHALATLKNSGHDEEIESIWLDVCTWEAPESQDDGEQRWRSFNPKNVGSTSYRTIFKLARENGWVNPRSAQAIPKGYTLRVNGVCSGNLDDTSQAMVDGVYKVQSYKDDGVTRYRVAPPCLCRPLRVIAKTSGINGVASHGLLVEFTDPNGKKRTTALPYSLVTDPGEFNRSMGESGLNIAPARSKDVCEYLHGFGYIIENTAPAPVTDRTGWNGDHDACFVLPQDHEETVRTIYRGESRNEVFFQSPNPPRPVMSINGTTADWWRHIGQYCIDNPPLILAIGAALAGPTLHLLGQENGAFHLFGKSTRGKSTLLEVARSVYGPKDTLSSWRATDNALEGTAERYNDLVLTLDEISQADAETVKNVTYMIGNGIGKERLNADASSKRTKRWRIMALSTGELSPQQIVATSSRTAGELNAGQLVRFPSIPVGGFQHGVFEKIYGHEDGKAFSEYLLTSSKQCYGAVGYEWITTLVDNPSQARERLTALKCAFESRYTDVSDQHRRVIQRFAVVVASLEYAVEQKVLDFKVGHCEAMVVDCVTPYLDQHSNSKQLTESGQIIDRIRTAIERHAGGRIENLSDIARRQTSATGRMGYMYRVDGKPVTSTGDLDEWDCGDDEQTPDEQTLVEYEFAFTKADLISICGNQFDINTIKHVLNEANAIRVTKSESGVITYMQPVRPTKQRRAPETGSKFYVVTSAIFETDSD